MKNEIKTFKYNQTKNGVYSSEPYIMDSDDIEYHLNNGHGEIVSNYENLLFFMEENKINLFDFGTIELVPRLV